MSVPMRERLAKFKLNKEGACDSKTLEETMRFLVKQFSENQTTEDKPNKPSSPKRARPPEEVANGAVDSTNDLKNYKEDFEMRSTKKRKTETIFGLPQAMEIIHPTTTKPCLMNTSVPMEIENDIWTLRTEAPVALVPASTTKPSASVEVSTLTVPSTPLIFSKEQFSLKNLDPFQALLTAYSDLVLEEFFEDECDDTDKTLKRYEDYKKFVDNFCKEILTLRTINQKNCFNKLEESNYIKSKINAAAYEMLSSENSPQVLKNRAILREIKFKAILAYILYVESQTKELCNFTEFSKPILRLLLGGEAQSDDVLISYDRLAILMKRIDKDMPAIFNFLKSKNDKQKELNGFGLNEITKLVKKDIFKMLQNNGLLTIETCFNKRKLMAK